MLYLLYSIIAILAVLLAASLYFNVKHGLIIINFTESIEQSLDLIDEKYNSISQILEKPVFFDSVEIRQVIKDIDGVRDSLLIIANSISKLEEDKEDGES